MAKRVQKKMTKTSAIQKLIAENKKLKMEKKTIRKSHQEAVQDLAKERKEKDDVVKRFGEFREEVQAILPSVVQLEEKLERQEMEHENEIKNTMEMIDGFLERNQTMFDRTHHILREIQNTSKKGIELVQLLAEVRDQETYENILKKAEELAEVFNGIWKSSRDVEHRLEVSPTCHKCPEERKEPQNIVPSTPLCQICAFEFSDSPGRIPRLLRCGHTLCEGCAQQIQQGSIIKCPFDRKETTVVPGRCSYLPKNFTVMDVIEKGVKQMGE